MIGSKGLFMKFHTPVYYIFFIPIFFFLKSSKEETKIKPPKRGALPYQSDDNML